MSAWLVRWRLALRIARRDALRHRGRTVLVLAMVGLPVLAVVGADTFFRTTQVTPVEEATASLGAADARISGESRERVYADPVSGALWDKSAAPADPPWTPTEVAALLPEDSRVVQAVEGRISYRTAAGRADVPAIARNSGDPVFAGTLPPVEGRLPEGDGEVAISQAIADRGYGVGDSIDLTRDDVRARVVGVVRAPAGSDGKLVVLPSSAATLIEDPLPRYEVSVPGGLDWPAVRELNGSGLVVVSRDVVADPPPPAEWLPPGQPADIFSSSSSTTAVMALVIASIVLEVVLLAGPAFAVGVRRQRRDLALIGAAGGAPGDLRRVVLASGLVLGGGASLLGAGLGVAAGAAALPVAADWSGHVFGPFEVSFLDIALTVAVGLIAGLAAAYFPARQAARTEVVETLAGRRGQVRTSWRSPVLGLLLAAAGMVLVVLGARGTELAVAGGAVLVIVGLVVASPWLVGLLGPLGRRLPVAGRLAVRDATRNRGRTAPALAAVMATVAGVTALSIGSASDSAQARRDYLPQAPLGTAVVAGADLDPAAWADVEAVLREQAPDRPVHRIASVPWSENQMRDLAVLRPGCSAGIDQCRWWIDQNVMLMGGYGEIVMVDAATARALAPGDPGRRAAELLADGKVAVFGGDTALDPQGSIVLAGVDYEEDETGAQVVGTISDTATLPAGAVPLPSSGILQLPATVLVPPELADRLPVQLRTTNLVTGGPDEPVTPAQEQQLSEVLGVLSGVAGITVERGWHDDLAIARYVLFGLGALLVLVATLTATGLALTDARPDFATLAAVGAAPRTRRFMAMASAAVVGGGGALLGVLAGLGPGIAVAYPLTAEDNWGSGAGALIDIPWLLLAGVALAVPLLAIAVTGLAVRSRLPMVSRVA